jgi:DNA-binding beta-propeller fold protein YncE
VPLDNTAEDDLSLKKAMIKMANRQAFRSGFAALAGIVLCTVSCCVVSAQQSKLRIMQTNSAGDNIHIIDVATNKVMGEINGSEAAHGVTVAPDGSRIYVSEEAGDTLVVLDGKTYGRPNGFL